MGTIARSRKREVCKQPELIILAISGDCLNEVLPGLGGKQPGRLTIPPPNPHNQLLRRTTEVPSAVDDGMALTPTYRKTREWPLLVLALALVCAVCIPLWQWSAGQQP